jgi:hypothetical protein
MAYKNFMNHFHFLMKRDHPLELYYFIPRDPEGPESRHEWTSHYCHVLKTFINIQNTLRGVSETCNVLQ